MAGGTTYLNRTYNRLPIYHGEIQVKLDSKPNVHYKRAIYSLRAENLAILHDLSEKCTKAVQDYFLGSEDNTNCPMANYYRISREHFLKEFYRETLHTIHFAYLAVHVRHITDKEHNINKYMMIMLYMEACCHMQLENKKKLRETLKIILEEHKIVPSETSTKVATWAYTLLGRLKLQRTIPKAEQAIAYSKKALDYVFNREIGAEAYANIVMGLNIQGKHEKSKLYQIKAVCMCPQIPLLAKLKEELFSKKVLFPTFYNERAKE